MTHTNAGGVAELAAAMVSGAQIACLVSVSDDGTPEVQLEPDGPTIAARLAMRTTRARLESAISNRQPIVVLFENADPARPIIVGIVETLDGTADESAVTSVEADVDGRRVKVTAQDEIVLQCGNASITLRRNGRIVVRGTYVETHSDGTNRIKGGQVQIN